MAKLSYEDEMLILGIYNSGVHTMIDIVTKTGLNDDSIRHVLRKYGLRVKNNYTKITDEHRRKAKELRCKGASYKDIAIALHVGCSTVKRLLQPEICIEKQNAEDQKQEQQMHLPICNEIKMLPIEALRMLRDALDMIIKAREDE